jgi:hypothetical protein
MLKANLACGCSPERVQMPSMTWLQFLRTVEWLTVIAVNVTVLYYLYPVYKRTKSRALMLIGYADLIWTFVSICNHTIGVERMTYNMTVTYRTLSYLSDIGASVLDCIGFLMLMRAFLKLHESRFGPPEEGESKRQWKVFALTQGGFTGIKARWLDIVRPPHATRVWGGRLTCFLPNRKPRRLQKLST